MIDTVISVLGLIWGVCLVLFVVIGNTLEFRAWRLRDRTNKRWWFTPTPIQHPEFFPTPEARRRRAATLRFYKRGAIALAVSYGALYLLDALLR